MKNRPKLITRAVFPGLILRPVRWFLRILAAEWKPLVAGAAVALLARAYVLDIYGVRKHSMEPTLHAEEGDADRVAVYKLAWLLSPPRRWDLCVFQRHADRSRSGETSYNVVKRVVGLPGEYVRIGREGDLYVGTNPADLPLLRKSPAELERLLIPIARLDPARLGRSEERTWEYDPACWRVEKGVLEGTPSGDGKWTPFAYAHIPFRGYIDPAGRTHQEDQVTRDFGLELTFRARSAETRLRLDLTAWDRPLRLEVNPGLVEMWADGKSLVRLEENLIDPARTVRLRFVQADRRLFLWVDGRALHRDIGPWPGMPPGLRVVSRTNRAGLAIAGGGIGIEKLQLVRDLHFTSTNGTHGTGRLPEALGEGEFYMLGDNSESSEDSRHYGGVSRSSFIGRPIMVVLPLTRVKWL